MLILDAPAWATLRHAYGTAEDIPRTIEQLHLDPANADAWEHLWSALCHQFDVYEASFAAVPHVVHLMANIPAEARLEAVNFVGTIAACALRPAAPAIPATLAQSYEAALGEAGAQVLECLRLATWDAEDYRVLLGALAAMRGEGVLAFDIFEAGRERACPVCESPVEPYSAELFAGEA